MRDSKLKHSQHIKFLAFSNETFLCDPFVVLVIVVQKANSKGIKYVKEKQHYE